MNTKSMLLLQAVLLFGFVLSVHADKRNYVWTYDYATAIPGILQMDYYLTNEKADTDSIALTSWAHQIEFEYGITERWDFGLCWEFLQAQFQDKSEDRFRYQGWKMRTGYRLADQHAWPVDIAGYVEYIRAADWREASACTLKLIIAKTVGNFDMSYNQLFASKLQANASGEHGYSLGLGYALLPELHLGIEAQGSYTSGTVAWGPTLALSPSKKFYFNLGVVYGANSKTGDVASRMILGMLF